MKKIILFFLVFYCLKSPGQGIIAKFSVSSENPTPTLTLTENKFRFTNKSEGNFTTISWEFPEGNPTTSTDANPLVTYTTPGYHLAKLTITNASGSSSSSTYFSIINGKVLVDLTSGRKADGTLCNIDEPDPNWQYRNLFSNTQKITPALITSQHKWSLPYRKDLIDPYNARYMSNRNTGRESSTTFQHEFIRTFTITEEGLLNFRALGKNQVKVFLDGNVIAETYVAEQNYTYQGFYNSWSTDPRDPATNREIYNIPLTKGTHVIKGWVRNEAGDTGFVLNGSVKANYSVDAPAAGFKLGNTQTCVGTPVTFKSTSEGSPVSYFWKFYNNQETITSTAAQPSVTFNYSGKYNVQLEVTYADGHVSTLSVDNYVNIGNCNAIYAPNSYIFDINQANYGGLYIPIKKAYEMWESGPYMGGKTITGTPSASVYWEDVSGLIKSVELNPGDTEIKVLVDKLRGKGNAVIALHSGPKGNSEDPVYWSWHIWVTDDPTQGVEYGHPNFPEEDIDGNIFTPKFMDRNLGATSNTFLGNEWNKSGGLYYQWGRKDPIPPFNYKDESRYNVTGTIGRMDNESYYQNQEGIVARPSDNISDNIRYSVQNPFKFINSPAGTGEHWFSKELMESQDTAFNLWSDNYEGKKGGNWNEKEATYKLKSPYDPCPDGWRVPSYRGAESNDSVVSPWGGQKGTEPGMFNGYWVDSQTDIASQEGGRYANVLFYPTLGLNFKTPFPSSNVSLLGNYSLTGKIWKYEATNTLKSQDHFAEGILWGATAYNNYARQFHYQSIAELVAYGKKVPEVLYIGPMSGAHTFSGNAVRCIQDPNRSKLNNFATKFIPVQELNYTQGLDNPNSYIVKNGDTQIKIPVSKAYSVYNQYLTDHGWPAGTQLFASAVWSTAPEVVKSVTVEGTNENANIVVNLMPNVTGNAVVALHIGNNKNESDPIYWSWHIWIPNGDPEQNTITYTTEDIKPAKPHVVNPTATGNPPLTTTFMDRDLGAEYALPKDLIENPSTYSSYKNIIKNSGGLHFQWGRKDPFPVFQYVGYSGQSVPKMFSVAQTAANGKVTYPNSLLLNTDQKYITRYVQNYATYAQTAGVKPTNKDYANAQQVLKYSINNPLTYLSNTTGSKDWLSDKKYVYTERWGHATKKSVFDPCPAGWRVPDQSFAFGWYDDTTFKGSSPWYNGRSKDVDNSFGIGITQHIARDIVQYYKGTELNTGEIAAWIFKNPEYPIGAYPLNLIRRAGTLDKFQSRTSGLWSASMSGGGYGMATTFGKTTMTVGDEQFPTETAMSVRCAKDEPRYTGATPPPNSWNMISSGPGKSSINTEKAEQEPDLKIYPNPTSGLFTIGLDNMPEVTVQIININGQIIYSTSFKNQNEGKIDIQNQPAGIYIVKIMSKQQVITKKIIKK